MKIFEIIEILRKDNNHSLWNRLKKDFTLDDWVELDNLKRDYKKVAHGKSQDKRVMKISTGEIYFNGKECYEKNNIQRCTFYAMMTGRRKKINCDYKYL